MYVCEDAWTHMHVEVRKISGVSPSLCCVWGRLSCCCHCVFQADPWASVCWRTGLLWLQKRIIRFSFYMGFRDRDSSSQGFYPRSHLPVLFVLRQGCSFLNPLFGIPVHTLIHIPTYQVFYPLNPLPSPFGRIHLTLAFLDFVYSASVFPELQATVNCPLPISHIQFPCTSRRHRACGLDAQSESIFLYGSFGLPALLQTFECVERAISQSWDWTNVLSFVINKNLHIPLKSVTASSRTSGWLPPAISWEHCLVVPAFPFSPVGRPSSFHCLFGIPATPIPVTSWPHIPHSDEGLTKCWGPLVLAYNCSLNKPNQSRCLLLKPRMVRPHPPCHLLG